MFQWCPGIPIHVAPALPFPCTKYYWEVLCASFAVRSSAGKYFVQALQCKVALGST